MTTKNYQTLKEQAAKIKAAEPRLRARDLAHRLGISEVQLVSLSVGENVTRLEGDWKKLLTDLKSVGYVMALTRNEHCVHERKGVYDNIKFYGGPQNIGVAVNPDIDLRFFMNEWVYALAVALERGKGQVLHGFQFFNKQGEAVHKVYTTPKSDMEAYHRLVKTYKAHDQSPITDIAPPPSSPQKTIADSEVAVADFQEAWKTLQDTHDFHGMLRKYGVTRTQGFRLAPVGFTEQVDNQTVIKMLQKIVRQQVPIMCFVHSKGCVQIHTGTIQNLKEYGTWYNVMDPAFNLHLDMSKVAQTWIVKKPTTDGIVTSLELFDEAGELIVYFFGARKPGKPELESWRNIMTQFESSNKTPLPL